MTGRLPAEAPPAPRLFDPVEATDFQQLEHAASLKGLLKPFKGKGELHAGGTSAARPATACCSSLTGS